ncbi:MAG: porin [Cyclobacteriaceae bacterium]
MSKTIYFVFILILFSKYCNAQGNAPQISFGAYIDTYYGYDFSDPLNNQRYFVTQYDRQTEFALNHGWIGAEYEGEKLRANLALQVGSYPANNYAAEPQDYHRMIYNAYAGLKITENSWLDVGVFGGHFGAESALALERALLSPALSTEYTPYYQTGLRYTHQLGDNTEIIGVVLNGWQNIAETNNQKSVGLAINQKISDLISIGYGNYYGNESTVNGLDLMRLHNNFVLQITPMEALSIVASADYTRQNNSLTDQVSEVTLLNFIGEFALQEQWSVAGRFEYVKDQDGVLITGTNGAVDMTVASLALNYRPTTDSSLKMEVKSYNGEAPNFVGQNGAKQGAMVLAAGLSLRIGQKKS